MELKTKIVKLCENIKISQIPVWLFLLLWCFSVMFWIEADSYTHDLFVRGDTAWFMAGGRAVFEGLVPYVDFSDSKGLLLWWIYALGYWINDYSYIGVFWISVLFSWGTFMYSYKTAMLLTENNKKMSLVTTLLMSFPYYTWLLQGRFMEFRCEDFCLLFISLGLYYLVKGIVYSDSLCTIKPGFLLGMGLIACIMIKWSIGVMYLGLICCYCFLLWRKRTITGFYGGLLGIFVACTPFIIAFIYYENFNSFIQEYFLNTSKTVSQSLEIMIRDYFFVDLKKMLTSKSIISLFWIISAMFYAYKKKQYIVPVLSGVFILLLAVKHDLGYYTIVVAPYAVFFCVMVAKRFTYHTLVLKYPVALGFIWWLLNTIPNFIRNEGMWYNSDRDLYYKTAYIIGQIKNARVINSTVGDPVGSIPGSKYWLPQLGETAEMAEVRYCDIRDNKADFVFGDFDKLIDKNRYQRYNLVDDKGDSISFWGVKGLRYPPKDFSVSDIDVLLKRRVINRVR